MKNKKHWTRNAYLLYYIYPVSFFTRVCFPKELQNLRENPFSDGVYQANVIQSSVIASPVGVRLKTPSNQRRPYRALDVITEIHKRCVFARALCVRSETNEMQTQSEKESETV